MARMHLAVDHAQTRAAAQVKFERAVTGAIAQFKTWIDRADWSEDRGSVRVVGPRLDVRLTYDDQKVYARGSVPIAFKLMEPSIRSFIEQALADDS
jgi:hypothetical protein